MRGDGRAATSAVPAQGQSTALSRPIAVLPPALLGAQPQHPPPRRGSAGPWRGHSRADDLQSRSTASKPGVVTAPQPGSAPAYPRSGFWSRQSPHRSGASPRLQPELLRGKGAEPLEPLAAAGGRSGRLPAQSSAAEGSLGSHGAPPQGKKRRSSLPEAQRAWTPLVRSPLGRLLGPEAQHPEARRSPPAAHTGARPRGGTGPCRGAPRLRSSERCPPPPPLCPPAPPPPSPGGRGSRHVVKSLTPPAMPARAPPPAAPAPAAGGPPRRLLRAAAAAAAAARHGRSPPPPPPPSPPLIAHRSRRSPPGPPRRPPPAGGVAVARLNAAALSPRSRGGGGTERSGCQPGGGRIQESLSRSPCWARQ